MKTTITLVLAFLITSISFAQQGINYKALIKDGGGNVVASQNIDIQFIIYEGPGETTNVYKETHATVLTDANGIVIVNIGEGSVDSGNYATIDWGSDDHFLNVQIDTGTGLTDMGTTQFMAVPYALNAANAASKIDDLTDGKSDNDGSSLFLGIDAGLNDDGTDNQNVGIGFNALNNNTEGYDNIAMGFKSLFSNTTGYRNIAIGFETLNKNTEGFWNTAIGFQSLFNNISGNQNLAIGFRALFSNISGLQNTAIGQHALSSNTIGNSNTANGWQALTNNTTGIQNTANGYVALSHNTEGSQNTANGTAALNINTTGIGNTASGQSALGSNIIGNSNTANGYLAGYNSLGNANIFIGFNSGYNELGSNTLYIENTDADADNALIYGEFGGDNTTTANILRTNSQFQIGNPTVSGYAFPKVDGTVNQVLQTDGSGSLSWGNTGVSSGLETLDEGNGIGWRLIDRDPLNHGNIGLNAVDISYSSSASSTRGATGIISTAWGRGTTASGFYSTAMGNFTTASENSSTAMGNNTIASGLISTAMGNTTTASENSSTAMGAGTTASGVFSTAMGLFTNASSYTSTALGQYNIGGGNATSWVSTDKLFEIGNGTSNLNKKNAFTVLKNGKVGISTSTPTVQLQIRGGVDASLSNGSGYLVIGSETGLNIVMDENEIMSRNNGATATLALQANGGDVRVNGALVHSSDRRLKKDIVNLPYGLNEILQLQPKAYNWKNREQKNKSLGLIAQDVQSIIKEIVHIGEDENRTLSLSYTELIPVLTKAIQEQQEIIEEQNKKLNGQESKIVSQNNNYEKLLKRVEQLELVSNQ